MNAKQDIQAAAEARGFAVEQSGVGYNAVHYTASEGNRVTVYYTETGNVRSAVGTYGFCLEAHHKNKRQAVIARFSWEV